MCLTTIFWLPPTQLLRKCKANVVVVCKKWCLTERRRESEHAADADPFIICARACVRLYFAQKRDQLNIHYYLIGYC